MTDKVLVMGLGNRVMTDDSAGLAALDLLGDKYELPPNVQLLDGGTLGLELLVYIEGHEYVLISDCVMGRCKGVGDVVRVEGKDVAAVFQKCLSPHQMGLKDLIAVMELQQTTPEKLTIVGVEGEVIGLGTDMTEKVAQSIPKMVELMVEELRQWGIDVKEKPREVAANSDA